MDASSKRFSSRAEPSSRFARAIPTAHASLVLLFASACASSAIETAARARPDAARPETETPPAQRGSSLGLVRGERDEADRWLAVGERQLQEGALDAARAAFERARLALPDHPAPLVGRVLVDLKLGGYRMEYACCQGDARLIEWRAAVEAAPASGFMPRFLLLGQLDLMLGNAAAARDWLARATTLAPDEPRVAAALGVAELASGNPARALSHFERAVELDPDQAASWTNLGAARMMNEAPERAKEAYTRAVELDPKSARAHSDLGTALMTLGQARAALVHLEEARRLAPERATILNNLGYAHSLLDDAERAEALYRAAIAREPSLASAWINLGVLKARQGRFEEAREALLEAQRLDPRDPRVIENLRELEREQARPGDE